MRMKRIRRSGKLTFAWKWGELAWMFPRVPTFFFLIKTFLGCRGLSKGEHALWLTWNWSVVTANLFVIIPWCWLKELWTCIQEEGLELRGGLGGANGKEPARQCRRRKRHSFAPWVRKIPWRTAWQPTPVFLPRESHGQRSLVGYGP